MISCFTVTQEGRLDVLARAIGDFRAQSVRDKEIVIVHDGSAPFHDVASRLVAKADSRVVVTRASPGLSLGKLRNLAIEAARGDFVCQWDDDDRCHPRRLEVQLETLLAAKADCCFLSDQLHFFLDVREMYWDDWDVEPYPLNFAPGTLFGRRERLARYPDLERGEDTAQVVAMLREGRSFARLREHGYLYVYVFDGRNSFDRAHHSSISYGRRFRGARLMRLEATLRGRLAEYAPPLGAFTMPYEGGRLTFA